MKYNKYHFGDLNDKSFLITGGAGFIGSHIVSYLIQYEASHVRLVDNLSTGNLDNLAQVLNLPNVEFIEGDIKSVETCLAVVKNINYVSHQSALGSVPRSIKVPLTTNGVNITGHLNILNSSVGANVERMVYAASSSTYGDNQNLPKKEEIIGNPLSPYAVTKYVNELYGNVYYSVYGSHTVGLRYFNVFGPRQSPNGQYAAVIPLFISSMLKSDSPVINGDGSSSRDFTYIPNVIQVNIKSMLSDNIDNHTVLNIAFGAQTSLLDLMYAINQNLNTNIQPSFKAAREGDVKHSFADINKAKSLIEYMPEVSFSDGIKETILYLLSK